MNSMFTSNLLLNKQKDYKIAKSNFISTQKLTVPLFLKIFMKSLNKVVNSKVKTMLLTVKHANSNLKLLTQFDKIVCLKMQ